MALGLLIHLGNASNLGAPPLAPQVRPRPQPMTLALEVAMRMSKLVAIAAIHHLILAARRLLPRATAPPLVHLVVGTAWRLPL